MKLPGIKLLWPAMAALALLGAAAVACGGNGGDGNGASPSAAATTARPVGSPAAIFSCADEPAVFEPEQSGFPITVADDTGRPITLEEPPSAIVSLSAGHTEILYGLGAGGQVVAADNFSDCPAKAAQLPHLDSFAPSVESIVALKPDLVIVFFDPGDLVNSLSAAGVPALLLESPTSVSKVYRQIDLLGQATGHPDQTGALIVRMRDGIAAITARLEDVGQGPTVFHEVSNDYYTAGPGSFVADLYTLLKARNIAEATGAAFPQMTSEAIIQGDPEVIVLADEDAGESADTVSARPGWSGISAVKNKRVHVIDPDIISRPGPRLVEALLTLAKFLYPDKFP